MSAGILSGLLGMGATIGGAVPNLLGARKQKRELERMQRGQGAGARAARTAASEAGRRVAGNVGGRGGSRNIRQGLRSAEAIGARGSQAAGNIAAQESRFATNALLEQQRQMANTAQQLGAGIGGQIGATQAVMTSAQDQGGAAGAAMTPLQQQEALQRAAVDAGRVGGLSDPSYTMPGSVELSPEQQEVQQMLQAPPPTEEQAQMAARGFAAPDRMDRQFAPDLTRPAVLDQLAQPPSMSVPDVQLQQSTMLLNDAEQRKRAATRRPDARPLPPDEYLSTLGARTNDALSSELYDLMLRIRSGQ